MKISVALATLLVVAMAIATVGTVTQAEEAQESYSVSCYVVPAIVAHSPSHDISGTYSGGIPGWAQLPTNRAGYFDSNSETTITYTGSSPGTPDWPDLSREEDDGGTYDVMTTYYTIGFKNPDGSVITGEAIGVPSFMKAEELVGNTTVLTPHEGAIYLWVGVETKVEWAYDAGDYTASLTLTATVNGE